MGRQQAGYLLPIHIDVTMVVAHERPLVAGIIQVSDNIRIHIRVVCYPLPKPKYRKISVSENISEANLVGRSYLSNLPHEMGGCTAGPFTSGNQHTKVILALSVLLYFTFVL